MKTIPTKFIVFADLLLLAGLAITAVVYFDLPVEVKNKTGPANLTPPEIVATTESIASLCRANNWHDCYQKRLAEATKTYGLPVGEQILLAIQERDDNAKNCHVIGHVMGREAYRRNTEDLDNLLQTLNVKACGSGFLHGVLEAYLGEHPEIEVNRELTENICAKKDDPYWQSMCVHLIGHVFLIGESGELERALPACDTVRPEWRFSCLGGLFMEDHQKRALAEHGILPEPSLTPEYMAGIEEACLRFSGIQGSACWSEMAEMYAHAYGYDPKIIFNGCSKAPTTKYRLDCYLKGAVVTSTYAGFDTAEKLTSICQFYKNNPNDYQQCTNTIISAFIYYSPKYTSRGVTLCGGLSADDRDWCFQDLGGQLKNLVASVDERKNLCQGAAGKFYDYCVNE